MKKIITLFFIIGLFFLISSNFQQNNIKEAYIEKADNGSITLNLKTDYSDKLNMVWENDSSVYFDLKNARLSDSYKTDYTADISVVTQQIGRKVRIYLKGENLHNLKAVFMADKMAAPVDYGEMGFGFVILSLIMLIAQKSYSAKMKERTESIYVKTPIKTAMYLNKQLNETAVRRRPEIVLNGAYTNPIQNEVYDFQFAKNKKNTKIAI